MHILQPKHSKLSEKESKEVLQTFNVSKSQLPKIDTTDAALPEGCQSDKNREKRRRKNLCVL